MLRSRIESVPALEAAGLLCWIARRDIQACANDAQTIVAAGVSARCQLLVFSGRADPSHAYSTT
jgi:hypothetical protein